MDTHEQVDARQRREHAERYEARAQWLGVSALTALVPFSVEGIRLALANGDEHLNSLPLARWDAQHGYHAHDSFARPMWTARVPCPCCGQLMTPQESRDETAGVWGLVRAAIRRDRQAGRAPLCTSWSLSDTVCVLKHVAREHMAAVRGGSGKHSS